MPALPVLILVAAPQNPTSIMAEQHIEAVQLDDLAASQDVVVNVNFRESQTDDTLERMRQPDPAGPQGSQHDHAPPSYNPAPRYMGDDSTTGTGTSHRPRQPKLEKGSSTTTHIDMVPICLELTSAERVEDPLSEDEEFAGAFHDPRPSSHRFRELVAGMPSRRPGMQEVQQELANQKSLRRRTDFSLRHLDSEVLELLDRRTSEANDSADFSRRLSASIRARSHRNSSQTMRRKTQFDAELVKHIDHIKQEPRRMSAKLNVYRFVLSTPSTPVVATIHILDCSLTHPSRGSPARSATNNTSLSKTSNLFRAGNSGRHGQAVGTYFRFLRSTFMQSLLMGVLYAAFVVIPASLNYSAYFIGSYMTETEYDNAEEFDDGYYIPLAYILVTGISILLIILYILVRLANNIYNMTNYVDEGQTPISQIVFTGYDHTVFDPLSVKLQRVALRRLLMCADVAGVHACPIKAVPISFEILARKEDWRTPLEGIQWTIGRSIILRIGSLYAFFYTYFINRGNRMCWETYVGQQVYTFVVINFIVEIMTSLFIDPVRKALYEKTTWFRKVVPSGFEMDNADRWIEAGALTGATCSSNTHTCADCLVEDFNASETVCLLQEEGPYSAGVATTLGELCAVCPSGCGPFRHQLSAMTVLLDEYATWPSRVKQIFDYMGTVAFAMVIIFMLVTWILIIKSRLSAERRVIARLQVERDMERLDKRWILRKFAITFEAEQGPNFENMGRGPVKWLQEFIAASLALPLSYHELIRKSVELYCSWLQLHANTPEPVINDPNVFSITIVHHLSQLFRTDVAATTALTPKHVALCKRQPRAWFLLGIRLTYPILLTTPRTFSGDDARPQYNCLRLANRPTWRAPTQDLLDRIFALVIRGLRHPSILRQVIPNLDGIFLLDVPGLLILVLPIVSACRMVLCGEDKSFGPRLRRAAISLLESMICLPLHYPDVELPTFAGTDLNQAADSQLNLSVVTVRIGDILLEGIRKEADAINMLAYFRALQLLAAEDESVRATMRVHARDRVAPVWLSPATRRRNLADSVLTFLRTVVDYITEALQQPPPKQTRYLHSIIVAAFHCLMAWLRQDKLLVKRDEYRNLLLKAVAAGFMGKPARERRGSDAAAMIASWSIVKDGMHRLHNKEATPTGSPSLRVQEAASLLLMNILATGRCTATLQPEASAPDHLERMAAALATGATDSASVSVWGLGSHTLATVIEDPQNAGSGESSLFSDQLIVLRDLAGTHVYSVRPHMQSEPPASANSSSPSKSPGSCTVVPKTSTNRISVFTRSEFDGILSTHAVQAPIDDPNSRERQAWRHGRQHVAHLTNQQLRNEQSCGIDEPPPACRRRHAVATMLLRNMFLGVDRGDPPITSLVRLKVDTTLIGDIQRLDRTRGHGVVMAHIHRCGKAAGRLEFEQFVEDLTRQSPLGYRALSRPDDDRVYLSPSFYLKCVVMPAGAPPVEAIVAGNDLTLEQEGGESLVDVPSDPVLLRMNLFWYDAPGDMGANAGRPGVHVAPLPNGLYVLELNDVVKSSMLVSDRTLVEMIRNHLNSECLLSWVGLDHTTWPTVGRKRLIEKLITSAPSQYDRL
ncbi:uncharacterized protein MONBRDRAFT_10475 [Monosiga brevicollis MX1]|uniref:TMC domain-containing protein n=1 Tax=Monosiga brevicollis TaxID=81824 RepID=A9V6B0_MONBE|nr:uncharacterized protein MONBRDRAFT_10475 [Monosiga brevicollis MX1]EDQ87037.1 predicted protein [Monosiga brevicollis MX1]|eukprot:XP_001748276.1 hypothetical protein [Monosiga brevicollis MX1]